MDGWMVWVEWNGVEMKKKKARGREGKRRGRWSRVEFFVLEHSERKQREKEKYSKQGW